MLQQIVLLRLKVVQLRLLFRDQQIVLPELLVEVLHLLIDQRDLMVDLCPLVNDVDRFFIVGVDLRLQFVFLRVDLVGPFLQRVQLILNIGGADRKCGGKQAGDQRQRQKHCANGTKEMLHQCITP